MVEVGGRVFVSHAGADRAWAEWVAWQLQDAGYEVELDCWDWGAGDNFVLKMNEALGSGRMLALFSEAYFDPERFTTQEWTAVVAAKEKLIPLRLDAASAPQVLRPLIAPSLEGLEVDEARRVLLEAVAGPRRPDGEPAFPGGGGRLRGMGGSGPRLPGSLPRVWNLPGRNAGFTGREGLLVHLRQALTSGSRVAVEALRGRGGVGKTQLAIEYGHRFAGEYELAWWIRSEEPALIPDQLAALAVKTGAAQADTEPGEALEALGEELRTRGRWLLVFDNAEDPAALAPYLPGGSGHVLITSRNPHWQDAAIAVEVDGFARTESLSLLQARVPELAGHDADRLAQELEDLPLALVQCAALLRDGLTLPQYLRLLRENISKVLDKGCPYSYPVSLAAQIRLSTEHLADTQPTALALLQACALLAPEPFPLHTCTQPVTDPPLALAALLNDPLEASDARGALAQQGLARVQDGAVQLHRLTQAVVRDQLTPAERGSAARAAEALLTAAYPGRASDPTTWPAWPDLVPHLLEVDPADLTTEDGRNAACDACWYLMDRGNASIALPRLEHIFRTWTRQLGPDHEHTLWAANYLARAYGDMRNHTQGRALAEDTLERRRRVLGEDDPHTLTSASNLASWLAESGEVEAARVLAEDTLERQRRIRGEDHPGTLITASILANRLAESGEAEAARALTEDTLERLRRVLGEDNPRTLHTALDLADRLAESGEVEASRVLTEDTLERLRRVLGEDHPHALHTALDLADRLAESGETEAARALTEDTLERRRRVLGEDHPHTLITASNLARWLAESGEAEASRVLTEDTLERLRRVLGEDHPHTLHTASILAIDLAQSGEVEAARVLTEDTLERRRRVLGEDDPHTLHSAQILIWLRGEA
ncbi:FxSxx-COOH system tetratricopeptide repeat protein [Streptomyces sp. NPDC058572]|uniref:FxSxx-COOH system tetratricopeptide repeat protein n=1 Tax=Streptomyces sp. NPDC058572 TaxID=3346546 RepID=UPI00364C38B3